LSTDDTLSVQGRRILKSIIFLALLLISQPGCGASGGAVDPVQNVNEVQAREIIASRSDIVIVDVRTPDEYNAGRIPGAVLINVSDPSFASLVDKLERSRTYLVYCRSGARSIRAVDQMVGMGFTSIIHLTGGFLSWSGAGYEVEQ
jgi:rhodanese-related sulfurtransferase